MTVLFWTTLQASESVVISEVASRTGGETSVVWLIAKCIIGALSFARESCIVSEISFRAGCSTCQIEGVKVEDNCGIFGASGYTNF